METILELVGSLESAGLIALFIAVCTKFVTGILAAVHEKNFKWSKFGDILRTDMIKYIAVLVLTYMYQDPLVVGPVVAVLSADMTAGVIRNVGRIFPNVGDKLPESILSTNAERDEPKQVVVEK